MVWPIIAIVISLLAFVVAGYFYQWVKKLPTAGAEIERIGKLIRDGAFTFLRREYRTLLIFCGAVSVIILLLFPNPVWTGMGLGANLKMMLAYLFGSVLSGAAGVVGISIATIANVRAASAAKQQAQGAEDLAAAIEEIASLADELQSA